VNYVGEFITVRQIIACDPREHVLDEDLGEKHVGVTILNYSNDNHKL
jgi:hypothetical protein